ncbi:hypothetical protein [Micromonospora sp. NBC_01638]|nr:hypothetical protein OG811_12680 [Micromonospora sp. NBC_01638]
MSTIRPGFVVFTRYGSGINRPWSTSSQPVCPTLPARYRKRSVGGGGVV